jgi:basic amino acid/polyamine antiporter, APA family
VTDRLARRIDLSDAVVIGMAAMLGAGVFAAFGPAAAAAGPWLLLGLVIAGAVAYANATSTATLASRMPTSGGIYAYASAWLSPLWGQLAGWAFLVGKTASCAAMALTFGTYVYEPLARPLAVVVVVAVTAINHLGVTKTAGATKFILGVVVLSLLVVVGFGLSAQGPQPSVSFGPVSAWGVLQSAGILFFAFAGYARIATLGEEVLHPERTIPRAIRGALLLTLLIYAMVAVAGMNAIGWNGLANATAPLRAVVAASAIPEMAAIVTIGAAVGSFGVLLSLTAGLGRTAFAMASSGDLPAGLARVHDRSRVPHVAGLSVAVVVVALVLLADLRGAIAVSSFAVLGYYAIGHAAAWRVRGAGVRGRRSVALAGLIGCVVLAFTLPSTAVVIGSALLGLGLIVFAWLGRRRTADGVAR